jgi:hypothetical protein
VSLWAEYVAHRLARAALCSLVMLSSPGCLGPTCDRDRGEPLRYEGGHTSTSGDFYETNALDEPFLHFPSGRSYELVHGLGAAPSEFHAYLAFAECPLSRSVRNAGGSPRCEPVDEDSGGGGFAEGAGNEAIFEVRGADTLIVKNDTCAEFYLRVIANTRLETTTPEADAGL